jgi:hypothetical protein
VQQKLQVLWRDAVKIQIWERLVGSVIIGYLATFTLNGSSYKVYSSDGALAFVEACDIINKGGIKREPQNVHIFRG